MHTAAAGSSASLDDMHNFPMRRIVCRACAVHCKHVACCLVGKSTNGTTFCDSVQLMRNKLAACAAA
jgi:hypothetical protein